VVDGRLARQGPTVLVADTEPDRESDPEAVVGRTRYQVLCRRHYRSGELAPNPTRPADV
jgi:thymidine kinase